ncbi:conserved Plasmodium protein, unknown function [Plasmodium gallinaceum]|uniref:Phytanoyl-CoA dioxygenase n=1 Tax=Plasmodium gallinaceum TaxID=5849 RepID=A0A1J1GZV1_PLAGA|nr:conserved Plasmodium protein, unknown function [Plasmodium gallinaceum]CRG97816.1 conserved Plasmodium protein, unknown function [Plasmodium gallinaceum]
MNKYKDLLTTKFEYKYLIYTLSFVSLNIGICNEYIKKKKLNYKNEEKKIYFNITEKNFEIINNKNYSSTIEKICKNFNFSIGKIAEASNSYYPLDYHLQYLNDILEKNKSSLKNIIEKESKNIVLDKLIEEIINYFELYIKRNDNSSSIFLKNVDFSHLKEFLIQRKKINLKSPDLLTHFIDELYAYIYLHLIVNYKRNNFFDFIKIKRSYRHCSENSGKDIGLELNNYLGINNNDTDLHLEKTNYVNSTKYVLNIDTVNEINKSLREYGIVVLKNFIPKENIDKIKQELFLEKNNMNISSFLMNKDQNIYCIRPTRGRQYCIIRNSKISDLFANIQQYWMNIIYSYLPIGSYENINNIFNKNVIFKLDEFNNLNLKNEHNDKLYLSELQLINNEPLSEVQTYHVDNGINGLSVILPLNKVNKESGNFEFFIGTHLFSSKKKKKLKQKIYDFKRFMELYYKTGSSFVPEVQEQDLIIYDSKILHRGLSNNLWTKNSSLIYRYDYKKYPPPGQDFIDIFSYNFIGKCISFFNFLNKYL